MATYIQIDVAKRLGNDLRRTVDLLREARDRLVRTQSVMRTMVDDPDAPADFAVLQAQYGLPSPGDSAAVYQMIADAVSLIAVKGSADLVERLG